MGADVPSDPFERSLERLDPLVEQHYRVVADASHREIADLSMGGREARALAALNHDRENFSVSDPASSIATSPSRSCAKTPPVNCKQVLHRPIELARFFVHLNLPARLCPVTAFS